MQLRIESCYCFATAAVDPTVFLLTHIKNSDL